MFKPTIVSPDVVHDLEHDLCETPIGKGYMEVVTPTVVHVPSSPMHQNVTPSPEKRILASRNRRPPTHLKDYVSK